MEPLFLCTDCFKKISEKPIESVNVLTVQAGICNFCYGKASYRLEPKNEIEIPAERLAISERE
jgi:hypothetical protein